MGLVTAAVILMSLTNGMCQTADPQGNKAEDRRPAYTGPGAQPDLLAQFNEASQRLARKVSPAVVQIEVTGFRPAEAGNQKVAEGSVQRERSVGAGMIVDADGYIMTNAHVVTGAQRIRVVLPARPGTLFDVSGIRDAQVLDAKVIGVEPVIDLALLKVEAHGLPALKFELKSEVQPGELVFAIGSPEGLQNSVSLGVVSSAWRQPNPDNPMVYMQTDAPMNPGNSGGPLLNVKGEVVGMNTFIFTTSGGSQGLGFAIPARILDFVYMSFRKYGYIRHIEIGAGAQTITPMMAEGLGLSQNWGVVISDVLPNGPAEAAGIKVGDVVVEVDGRGVVGLPGFAAALFLHRPDDLVQLTVLRAGQRLRFSFESTLVRDRLDQLADLEDLAKSHIGPLGVVATDLTGAVRDMLSETRIAQGVLVIAQEEGVKSAETGLLPGDIIHTLNRTEIASVEQLRAALAKLNTGDAAVLRIERKGQLQFIAFEAE